MNYTKAHIMDMREGVNGNNFTKLSVQVMQISSGLMFWSKWLMMYLPQHAMSLSSPLMTPAIIPASI